MNNQQVNPGQKIKKVKLVDLPCLSISPSGARRNGPVPVEIGKSPETKAAGKKSL